jgi:predicted phage replisome organizer
MINWIKLDINILDDAKIKIIRSHPDGDSVVLLWIGLLCLAMKSSRPGTIEISDGLPYTVDDLSNLFHLEKKTVEMGLALFVKYRMVEVFEGGTIEVINFSKHQKLEEIERIRELTKARMAKYRERLRITHEPVTRNKRVTIRNVTPTDLDLDLDLDNRGKGKFIPPSIDDVAAYCRERENGINPTTFVESYSAKGWMIGKNKMKDWRAAIRTWETRDETNQKGERTAVIL